MPSRPILLLLFPIALLSCTADQKIARYTDSCIAKMQELKVDLTTGVKQWCYDNAVQTESRSAPALLLSLPGPPPPVQITPSPRLGPWPGWR